MGTMLLVVVLVAMSLVYGYPEILGRRPQGLHTWRQSDCLSITLNYFRSDLPINQSRIHYLGELGTGRTISEFPLLHYGIGHLWRMTGQSELLFRAVVLLFFACGMYALFRTLSCLLNDHILSVFIVALLFTSPMLVYYANNFLMNVPALSAAFVGWFLISKYWRSHRRSTVLVGLGLFTLAALFKATSALSLLSILGILVLDMFLPRWGLLSTVPYGHKRLAFVSIAIALALLGAWYSYAASYNAVNGNAIFLVGILPIWDLTPLGINEVLRGVRVHLERDYFRPVLYPVFLFALFAIWRYRKAMPKVLVGLLGLVVFGIISICLLFFQALREHDYYSLDQLIVVPLALALGAQAVSTRFPGILRSRWAQLTMLILLIHCTDFARRRMADRYGGWMNAQYLSYQKPFGEIAPYLTELGIAPDDRVISLPDPSPNNTLYLMNRSGWTDYDSLSFHPERINRLIDLHAKYLFVFKPEVYARRGMEPYLTNPIGHYRNIDVYRLPEPSRQFNPTARTAAPPLIDP